MQRRLGFIEMLDKRDDAALVAEHLLFFFALIFEGDCQSLIEERQLSKTLGQHVEAELQDFENLTVRLEGDFRSTFFGLAGCGKRGRRFAALILLFKDLAVLPDFQLQPFGERIHHRDAHAMKAARHRIGALFELPAGVQHGQGHLGGGLLLRGMHAGRNTAAIVDHDHAAVDMQRDLDRLAEAGHVFVDAIVDDFIDQMVKAFEPVLPMYIAGRLRTASSPSRTLIWSAL